MDNIHSVKPKHCWSHSIGMARKTIVRPNRNVDMISWQPFVILFVQISDFDKRLRLGLFKEYGTPWFPEKFSPFFSYFSGWRELYILFSSTLVMLSIPPRWLVAYLRTNIFALHNKSDGTRKTRKKIYTSYLRKKKRGMSTESKCLRNLFSIWKSASGIQVLSSIDSTIWS